MLEADRVRVDFESASILRDAAIAVQAGQMVGLIGGNGAGKTTFLRAIMGLARIRSGRVTFDQVDITKTPPQRRAFLGIGYMPEDRRLVPSMTAEENVMVPAWSAGIPDWEDRLRWIHGLMPEVEELGNHPATSLSGGQQKLVALARALMVGSRLLLLDEPSEGVAPALARRMSGILHDLKGEGVGILTAESDMRHCADLMDAMFAIERGAVRERPIRPVAHRTAAAGAAPAAFARRGTPSMAGPSSGAPPATESDHAHS